MCWGYEQSLDVWTGCLWVYVGSLAVREGGRDGKRLDMGPRLGVGAMGRISGHHPM